MTLFYPRQPGTGELAYLFRLAFSSGMAASLILGFTAIRRPTSRERTEALVTSPATGRG